MTNTPNTELLALIDSLVAAKVAAAIAWNYVVTEPKFPLTAADRADLRKHSQEADRVAIAADCALLLVLDPTIDASKVAYARAAAAL